MTAIITGKRLPVCPTEFETGIFMAAYASPLQRRRRALALMLLGFKHMLRGLAFSWPAYLLLLVPALALSLVILARGVRDDYHSRVNGVLLDGGFVRGLLFPAAP